MTEIQCIYLKKYFGVDSSKLRIIGPDTSATESIGKLVYVHSESFLEWDLVFRVQEKILDITEPISLRPRKNLPYDLSPNSFVWCETRLYNGIISQLFRFSFPERFGLVNAVTLQGGDSCKVNGEAVALGLQKG